MGKTKITIELDDEIVEKIKDLQKKFNDNPMFTEKFADIPSYISHVITSQIKSADKMSEKLEESLKKFTEKLSSLDLGDMDFSKLFGTDETKKEKKKESTPDKNVKN
ncbi:MAG: hypothetical protein K2L48_00120 [Mycoplasmoidaceae bacterium]|nr:hypothetical protein [Mycoplasmoidaceae bacterium]